MGRWCMKSVLRWCVDWHCCEGSERVQLVSDDFRCARMLVFVHTLRIDTGIFAILRINPFPTLLLLVWRGL